MAHGDHVRVDDNPPRTRKALYFTGQYALWPDIANCGQDWWTQADLSVAITAEPI
jgi:hypothetical protein